MLNWTAVVMAPVDILSIYTMLVTAAQCQTWMCSNNCVNKTCWSTGVCIYGCLDGFWGGKCLNSCPSICKGICDQSPPPLSVSNTPSCDRCPQGKYRKYDLSECTSDCPVNCVTCMNSYACYECKEGYFITEGYYTCIHECSKSCKTCLSGTQCLECKDSYYNAADSKSCSQLCPVQCRRCTSLDVCQECIPPYYNEGSVTNCTLHCPGMCLCSSPGLCSTCIDGFYGTFKNCSISCPANCLSCSSDANCFSCKQGYYIGREYDDPRKTFDSTCGWECRESCTACTSYSNCSSCVLGHYGQYCQYQCSAGCINSVCDIINGHCTCKELFVGTKCDQCKPGLYGSECNQVCTNNCNDGMCIRSNGACVACKSEKLIGSKCQFCVDGYYGLNCSLECSQTCKDSVCQRDSGLCLTGCKNNFIGDMCEVCIAGKYGETCNLDCPENCFRDICHKNNGTCIDCKADFQGEQCDKCRDGFYGENCSNLCKSSECLRNVCNRESGLCEACTEGMHGLLCMQTCSDTCLSTVCDVRNGTCTTGCVASYSGDMCCLDGPNCEICSSNTNCQVCKAGFYGKSCNLNCPMYCERCSNLTGECTECARGKFGTHCNENCSAGCFSDAGSSLRCNISDGACVLGCKGGFWGKQCEKRCSNICVNYTCDTTTGACLLGCTSGIACDKENASIEQPSVVGPAVGGAVAAIFTIAMAIAIVMFFWKRRKRNINSRGNPQNTDQRPRQDIAVTSGSVYYNTQAKESTVNVYWTAWGAWGAWGQCSATCGTGLQARRRNCTHPKPGNAGRDCFGDLSDYQLCNLTACSSTNKRPTTTTNTTTPTCPEDWFNFTSSCYFFSQQLILNFIHAQAQCEQDGAHLAFVENEEENNFIKQHIINNGLTDSFWIGLSDEGHDGVWKYYGTEKEATFFNWHTGEPTYIHETHDENCVELREEYNYDWNDLECTVYSRNHVCEKEM